MAYFYNDKSELYNGRIIDTPRVDAVPQATTSTYSSVSTDPEFDLDLSGITAQKPILTSTIHTFPKRRNKMYGHFQHAMKPMLNIRFARRTFAFIVLNIFVIFVLFMWCNSSNSLALRAFLSLSVFDFFTLLTCLLSIWVATTQRSVPDNSVQLYSYERIEILLVFSSLVLTMLGSVFILKESILRIVEQPDVAVGRLLPGALLGLVFHVILTFSIRNKALQCVTEASPSSLIQEHVSDLSQPLCTVIPVFNRILLPRIDPFFLLSSIGSALVLLTDVLIQIDLYYTADTVASILFVFATLTTMWPIAVCSAQVLLNTTPPYVLGQLDKLLSEAQTLDGVLEIRNERFFSVALASKDHTDLRFCNGFGLIMAGSVCVRVRRDADEQMVLAHVTNRLSPLVTQLTVQVVKDDWSSGTYSAPGIPSSVGLKSTRPMGSAILYGFNKPAAAVVPYQQTPPRDLLAVGADSPSVDLNIHKFPVEPSRTPAIQKRLVDDFSFSSTPALSPVKPQSFSASSNSGSNIAKMYKAAGFTSPPSSMKSLHKLPPYTTKRTSGIGGNLYAHTTNLTK
ncbi:unnamed protein product [Clavelina lepadiformis]|uniref:Cation efflux protein transmembrane domain-containing protein n=1 Tax=Clavelina lepadiformis TaxID=159417 RepID=A0ABP0GSP9_CLALP